MKPTDDGLGTWEAERRDGLFALGCLVLIVLGLLAGLVWVSFACGGCAGELQPGPRHRLDAGAADVDEGGDP